MSIVEFAGEIETKCTSCGAQATVKNLVLKDTKPYKMISQLCCIHCQYMETHEEDYETLDHGVEITCNFTNTENLHNNIRRMVFVNHHSKISFYEGNNYLFDINSSIAYVDCVEGIIMKIEEILSSSAPNEHIDRLMSKLNAFRSNTGFTMKITDNTGYSRVCPEGAEYTEIQDVPIDELNKNNTDVIHEKIPKAEQQQ